MHINRRPSFINFPIPFDHPYIIPTLAATVTASAFLYYSLQATHKAELREAIRKQVIHKRRHLTRSEDKYASLKIDKQYVNPFKEWNEPELGWLDYLMNWLGLYKTRPGSVAISEEELDSLLPVMKPSFDIIRSSLNTTFTWLGESTCIFSLNGLVILTDPVFDVPGLNRLRPAPCTLDDIKDITDIVLITHNHSEHLDENVAIQLGNKVTWYIPMGLRGWFQHKGIENVVELDWWQEIHHKNRPDILIACVPAMHSSCTHFFHENESLWCSFVLKSREDRIFFCGDTGYVSELFQSIRNLYSPFTIAALPIGTLSSYSLDQSLHMNPDEVTSAHKDLGSPKISIGIHWGTFLKSQKDYLLPAKTLIRRWNDPEKHKSDDITTAAIGETISIV